MRLAGRAGRPAAAPHAPRRPAAGPAQQLQRRAPSRAAAAPAPDGGAPSAAPQTATAAPSANGAAADGGAAESASAAEAAAAAWRQTGGAAAAAAAADAPNSAATADAAPDAASLRLTASVLTGIDQVNEEEWDAVACGGGEVNPFVSWRFLWILEASGSAVPEAGWGPRHLVVRDEGGRLVGCCPLYLKGHSYGEYVFDSSWAQFYSMNGGRYYPKLQCCVPFTPVTGPRLMTAPGPPNFRAAVTKALAETLVAATEALGASSLHVTFSSAEEWAAMGALGLQQRRGIQYHWENAGYSSFDDFLAALKQSKRKSIRQERKAVEKQGLRVRRLTGSGGPDGLRPHHWERFHTFYTDTVDKRWGSAYLTRRFFEMLGSDMADRVLLVAAEDASGEMVAGALNMIGSHALFGRNWGCTPGKEWKGLHFECCYYSAIEEAIARGLPRVEAGAQGEHKMQRGYLPNFTYSAHYCRDPLLRSAVGRFLEREAQQVNYSWQALTLEASPYKQERTISHLEGKIAAFNSLSSASSLSSADLE
ncbi:hypothetical protein Rsub_03450 [Raphidocelis subcapitata]|uniref:Uncharacterized protein n=1 Tax=Raphidocelis subcapitata TaxID=307507 RepID=A0A2V0NS49_9CHLO|nr:hypothetical protein Rsub_03450 [Raphidocelis subcapitata]|eukprot:GBF90454.1 hypothetical protein Rsub_03450 [Raphidocelis subcapitata]